MNPNWRDLSADLVVEGDYVYVDLDDDRMHDILITTHPDGWEISGFVADASTLASAGLNAAELWRRNRFFNLVGYLVDENGNAWVTAWVPHAGSTPAEFAGVARHVAIEADRMEYYLTGDDVH